MTTIRPSTLLEMDLEEMEYEATRRDIPANKKVRRIGRLIERAGRHLERLEREQSTQ